MKRWRREGQAYDRRAANAPSKTMVAVDVVADPLAADPLPPQKGPALRRDGSLALTGPGEWMTASQPGLMVLRAVRDDPLGFLRARGSIDEAQFLAGRKWQELNEASVLGSIQAMDTTKEAVDGGRFPEPLTERQSAAIKRLLAARAAIIASHKVHGRLRSVLVSDILGGGLSIAKAAVWREVGQKLAGREFRAGLNVIAEEFGFRRSGIENPASLLYKRPHNRKLRQKRRSPGAAVAVSTPDVRANGSTLSMDAA